MTVEPSAKVVYYAVAYGVRRPGGQREPVGAEHPAGSFGEARRHLDYVDHYGLVFRWTHETRERQLVAKRLDNGSWWEVDPIDQWVPLEPGAVPEPKPAPAAELEPEAEAEVPVPVLLVSYVNQAAAMGHRVRPAQASMSNKLERWGCTTCDAVLLRNDAGEVYGTALTERCTAQAGAEQPPNAS